MITEAPSVPGPCAVPSAARGLGTFLALAGLLACAYPLSHQRSLLVLSDDVAGRCRRGVAASCAGPGVSVEAARAVGAALTGQPVAPESRACQEARARCDDSVPCLRAVAEAVALWQLAAGEIAAKSDRQSSAERAARASEGAARAKCAALAPTGPLRPQVVVPAPAPAPTDAQPRPVEPTDLGAAGPTGARDAAPAADGGVP